MSARRAAGAVLLAGLVCPVAGLGCDADGGEPAGSLREDAEALRRVMESDPAVRVIGEVDRALEREGPGQAADLLERSGLPAARRQLERVEGLEAATGEGGKLRDRAAEAYRDRLKALESYRDLLASDEIPDEELVTVLRDQRRAEGKVLDLLERLDRLTDQGGASR